MLLGSIFSDDRYARRENDHSHRLDVRALQYRCRSILQDLKVLSLDCLFTVISGEPNNFEFRQEMTSLSATSVSPLQAEVRNNRTACQDISDLSHFGVHVDTRRMLAWVAIIDSRYQRGTPTTSLCVQNTAPNGWLSECDCSFQCTPDLLSQHTEDNLSAVRLRGKTIRQGLSPALSRKQQCRRL